MPETNLIAWNLPSTDTYIATIGTDAFSLTAQAIHESESEYKLGYIGEQLVIFRILMVGEDETTVSGVKVNDTIEGYIPPTVPTEP